MTLTVEAMEEPYFGGSSAKLEITAACSRCAAPYVPEALRFPYEPGKVLAEALEFYCVSKQGGA